MTQLLNHTKGQAIKAGRGDDPCNDETFLHDYDACLQCAGEDNVDIWKYYGGSLSSVAASCGLSTTPLTGTQAAVSAAITATSAASATGAASASATATAVTTPSASNSTASGTSAAASTGSSASGSAAASTAAASTAAAATASSTAVSNLVLVVLTAISNFSLELYRGCLRSCFCERNRSGKQRKPQLGPDHGFSFRAGLLCFRILSKSTHAYRDKE